MIVQRFAAQWKKLPARERRLAMIFGAAVAVWIIDTAVLQPLRSQIRSLQDKARDREKQLIEAVIATDQAETTDRALEQYSKYLDVPQDAELEVAAVLTEVEKSARASGMALLSLRPAGETHSISGFGGISISLEGEGSPQQLVELLSAIQRSARLLKVTEMNISVSTDRTLRARLVIDKLFLGSSLAAFRSEL